MAILLGILRGSKKAVGAQERNLGREEYRRAIRERPEELFTNRYPGEEALVIHIPLNKEAQDIDELQPPVDQPPNNQEENTQQPDSTMAMLEKNFPVFTGRKTEDANIHVNRFEHYWKVARPRDPNLAAVALEELKRDAFINTFAKGATEWISRYNENHFNTYAPLVAAFLQRFHKEKSSSQLCSNIRELQQGRMDVEAYASKLLSMRQRVEE